MSISVSELVDRLSELKGQFIGGSLSELVIRKPAEVLLASIKNRVKNKGIATDGSSLRRYSTDPIYAGPDKFIKGGFRPQGKRNFEGNTIGDRLIPTARLKTNSTRKNPVKYSRYTLVKPNLQTRKTMYLQDGYMELRDIQGLRTDITNMSYSGQMLEDYGMQQISNGYVLGMTTERGKNIYLGQTYGTRYMRGRGMFLQASAEEIEKYKEQTLFNITRLTVGLLKNGEQINAVLG